jgi:hypothetical protein
MDETHDDPPQPTVEELIAAITPENIHPPMFEELVGRERW